MQLTPVEPVTVPAATGGYVNALQVEVAARLPFIRGQIPQTREGLRPTASRTSAGWSGRT
ncbi:MAG: hypothetical protein H0U09_12575 [Geodermatophilaceae bacterium]|nr:hypothetical protein [Geodermatophilaceae bacterium]